MITSLGLDIVEIERIARDIESFGDRFLNRVLSESERRLYDSRLDKAQFVAGRFAAKEAAIKGLGAYLTTAPALASLEIMPDANGCPQLHFPPELREKLASVRCLVSITHERKVAAAVVVFEE